MGKRAVVANKDELSEDLCFFCKDGGHLRVCDYKNCLKAYHPECVNKDSSFLESDELWTCGLHTCFNCQKSSTYHCYCCPNSSACRACIGKLVFVPVKTKTKGFCGNCLRMTTLIEENIDVDSDGVKIDFKDTDTSEFLFKEYWDLIKEKEGIGLVDLRRANARLKGAEKYEDDFGIYRLSDDDLSSEDDSEDSFNDEGSLLDDMKEKKRGRKKMTITKCNSKKRVFVSWGSEELIKFLASIGRLTKDPLTQLDASEIIKDYVEANNLYQHDHKKKKMKYVICDERLQSLFRKKKMKQQKIYSLLQGHFASNEVSDFEFSLSSEEGDDVEFRAIKRQRTNLTFKSQKSLYSSTDKLPAPKNLYAAVVKKNIKAVYLKRSLVIDLLKDPNSFDKKVSGCFVRVKHNLKDFLFKPQKNYWLGQVIGVKKDPQGYKIKETFTDIVLCVVSNTIKDIQISFLSDEEFEEEECEDLRQLVKKGHFRRPTVAELAGTIKNIHADITKHWLDKEITKLQKLIDRANEKGWRKELHEYIDKRELLLTSTERKRLLEEIPEVIPETCVDEDNKDSGQEGVVHKYTDKKELLLTSTERKHLLEKIPEVIPESCKDEDNKDSGQEEKGAETNEGATEEILKEKRVETNEGATGEIPKEKGVETNEGTTGEILKENETEFCENESQRRIKELPSRELNATKKLVVIEIEDDDDDPSPQVASSLETTDRFHGKEKIWHYCDPFGKLQGPFDMFSLVAWHREGYFTDDFKVWRSGQSLKDGTALRNAKRMCIM